MHALGEVGDGLVDAAVHAEGQAVAGGVDAIDQRVQLLALEADHMQHGAEDLALQARGAVDLDQRGCHVVAVEHTFLALHAGDLLARCGHLIYVLLDLAASRIVDHGAHIGVQAVGVAQRPFLQRLAQHGQRAVGHIVLQAQQAQGGTALAGRIEGRGQHIGHHLLGQGRGVHHHGVLAAGLGNQRNGAARRRQAPGQLARDQARHLGGAREHHARHLGMCHQGRAHGLARARHQLQRVARHAGLVQQGHHGGGRQRCLLGGLGQHRVAGGQGRGYLPAEDGQREIPGADGQHHAQRALRGVVEMRGRLGAVVAQEVHGLADLGHGVGKGLAGLPHDQAHQRLAALLQQVGGTGQRVGTGGGRCAGPDGRGLRGARGGGLGLGRRGLAHPAHDVGQLGRVAHGLPALGTRRVGRQVGICGSGQIGLARAVQQRGGQRGQLLLVRQVQALGIGAGLPCLVALLREQIGRQCNARVGSAQPAFMARDLHHLVHRVGHQVGNWHGGIADAVHERGVGTVLQQAAHQVGQQRLMAAHGRIDAAGAGQLAFGGRARHLRVQRLAHAVQTLEFVLAAVVAAAHGLGQVVDAGQGLRVVRGELGVDGIGRIQQLARAGQVAHVGIDLARIDRVAGLAAFLGALDLAVPVGALDQAHHQAAAAAAGQVHQVVQHLRAALLVGLDHKAYAVPALERRRGTQGLQQVQRQLQPVGLLGVDVHADVVLLGQLGQLQHARQQLGHHALVLRAAVARVQGRQLDGDARPLEDAAPVGGRANRVDGLLVRLQIALCIGIGGGRFAQHVVAVAKALFFIGAAVGQRLGNVLARHELLAHQLHGAVHALADQRLAALADHARQRRRQVLLAAGGRELARQHQAPGRRVHEQRGRAAHMGTPVALADLVADQRIARGTVGNAQQRLGQAHQRHAFLAGQRELLHQSRHAAAGRRIAQALHQPGRQFAHLVGLLGILGACQRQQHGQALGLGPVPGGRDGGAQRRLRQDGLGEFQERLYLLASVGLRLFDRDIARAVACACKPDGGCAALQRIDVLDDGLFDQPVRCAPDLLGGDADALAQCVINLDAYGGGHGVPVRKREEKREQRDGDTGQTPGATFSGLKCRRGCDFSDWG